VRRRAQLAAARPDFVFGPLRGNIDTRLRKAEGFDAIVVAAAALDRLGYSARAAELLAPSVMLPQVAQGALAVECRADDEVVRDRLATIDDSAVRAAVTAERAFLAALGGGCDLPCGALASATDDGVAIEVMLATLDGRVVLRTHARGSDPSTVGTTAAETLLTRGGGTSVLEGVAG
jgi:hydroxymethylbilane synthase